MLWPYHNNKGILNSLWGFYRIQGGRGGGWMGWLANPPLQTVKFLPDMIKAYIHSITWVYIV